MDQVTVFGLDLGESYSQISYYRESMEDVASISPKVGSQSYMIRTAISKREGISQWIIGEDALKLPNCKTSFLAKAYKREQIEMGDEKVDAIELLTIFIRRVLSLTATVGCDKKRDYFLICIEHASKLAIESLLFVTDQLGIERSQVKICDKKEAFFYYVMNQNAMLCMQDVLLLDYWNHSFTAYQLHVDRNVTPHVVSVAELQLSTMDKLGQTEGLTKEEIDTHKDTIFLQELDTILGGKMISSVYLVGQGFEGDWMKRSLSRLCAGRRVFFGMNLFAKGACYYGCSVFLKKKAISDFLYLGGGNLLYNVCLKVFHKNEYIYHVIIGAGLNWQDAKGALEVLLEGEGEPVLEIVCKSIKNAEEITYPCKLEGLAVEKDRTTRIRIEGEASSQKRVSLKVKETGFGELKANNHGEWEFTLKL